MQFLTLFIPHLLVGLMRVVALQYPLKHQPLEARDVVIETLFDLGLVVALMPGGICAHYTLN